MFKNYLKITLRNFIRNPIFNLINILSLTIGIVCCLLIILYISHELSYDRFHQNGEWIYRVAMESIKKEGNRKTGNTTAAVGPSMLEEIPEVEQMVRLRYPVGGYYYSEGKQYYDRAIVYADSSLLHLFSFTLIAGNPETILREPYSVVLTQETAGRIFGTLDPIGEQLVLNNENYLVTGVIQAPPVKSHIQFTSLVSFSTLYKDSRFYMDWNGGWQYYTYIKLYKGADIKRLKERMPDFMYTHINHIYEEAGSSLQPIFQQLSKIHMDSEIEGGFGPGGSKSALLVFSAIALFILIIASINFMNLSTARATTRAKEVGIRKVVGANRKKIIWQFLGESTLLSLFGLILALILIEIILPKFNIIIGRELRLYSITNWKIIMFLPLLVILIGIFSGSYPSFYTSAFQPTRIIKGDRVQSAGNPGIRNLLVIIQFIISTVLIICTLVIYFQIVYMKDKDVGYDKESILTIPMIDEETRNRYEVIKTELSTIPEVISISASSDYPGHSITSNGYLPEGLEEYMMINVFDVDYDFLDTYGLEVVSGRGFSEAFPTDKNDYLINEKLAEELGWDEPVGKLINRGADHKVVGVVKDFNFATLHEEIKPLIFTMTSYMGYRYLSISITRNDLQQTIQNIRGKWETLIPGSDFNYFFLDDEFDRIYQAELRFGETLFYFSMLAILIACMGLFGLASYTTAQKTKEIGIRKVMGASSGRIMRLFSLNFTKWVVLANLIAWPLAILIMRKWLQNFNYKIEFPVWVLIAVTAGISAIAILTISFHTIKVANTQPANTLKYE